jgi:arylsulfatase A-like enzyme
VVDGDYKLILDTYRNEIFLELYNVREDPQEKDNLAAAPAYEARTKALLAMLRQHMRDTDDLLKLPDQIYENFVKNYIKKQEKTSGDDQ